MIHPRLLSKNSFILEETIPVRNIVNKYKFRLKIDVSGYFKNVKEIKIYRSLETGFRFYWPPIAGDSKFYQSLQKLSWYYMSWKWEHGQALRLIRHGDVVLEVGFGNGSFLIRLSKLKIKAAGIELNRRAFNQALKNGLAVFPDSLAAYSKKHGGAYNVVCCFQLLEHLPDPGLALRQMINLLKPGGRLIISVPNNDSFYKDDKENVLNLPPHHLGLWAGESLKKLVKEFPIKLNRLEYEPLQKYKYVWYYNVKLGNYLTRFGKTGKVLADILSYPVAILLSLFSGKIKGHVILAEYQKLERT